MTSFIFLVVASSAFYSCENKLLDECKRGYARSERSASLCLPAKGGERGIVDRKIYGKLQP